MSFPWTARRSRLYIVRAIDLAQITLAHPDALRVARRVHDVEINVRVPSIAHRAVDKRLKNLAESRCYSNLPPHPLHRTK